MISHGHIDHVGACISHARAKALSSSPSTYLVPHEIVESLEAARKAFSSMDGAEIPMNIVGISPGDTIMISRFVEARVFATEHRVASQGYALYYKHKGRLLPEFQSLDKKALNDLRLNNVNIVGPDYSELAIVYTGDTTMDGLLKQENSFLFDAPILITELTYLDREPSKAKERGHIHINDIIENSNLFRNNQIVFVHISQRYNFSQVIELMRSKIPYHLLRRVRVNLTLFGCNKTLVSPSDERWSAANEAPGWGWSNYNSNKHYNKRRNSGSRSNFNEDNR